MFGLSTQLFMLKNINPYQPFKYFSRAFFEMLKHDKGENNNLPGNLIDIDIKLCMHV